MFILVCGSHNLPVPVFLCHRSLDPRIFLSFPNSIITNSVASAYNFVGFVKHCVRYGTGTVLFFTSPCFPFLPEMWVSFRFWNENKKSGQIIGISIVLRADLCCK
jgi:hypothetical protein